MMRGGFLIRLKKNNRTYVPPSVFDELENVKVDSGVSKQADAFKEMVKFSRLGREADKMIRLDFFGAKRAKNKRIFKKGSARDVVLFPVLIFLFGLGFFVMNFMAGEVQDKFAANPTFNSSELALNATNTMQSTANQLDYVVFGLFIGLFLAMIITSFLIGGHPIFMLFYFIVIVVATIVGAILSNTWEDATSIALFGTTINNLPLTNHIMSFLPYYVVVIGFIGVVVMFARPSQQ